MSANGEVTSKHAYMIMAHNEWGVLKKQLHLLDDVRNDIFLHIDVKAVAPANECINTWVRYAHLHFVKPSNICWGSFGQIDCELRMLSEIVKKKENYSYIHFISGVDLPIKSQNWIHEHLSEKNMTNYISCKETDLDSDRLRVDHYHFVPNVNGGKRKFFKKIDSLLGRIQSLLGVHRIDKSEVIYKGSNWFSIKPDLAEYILSQEEEIKKTFKNTLCADELFLQMLVMKSPFADTIGKGSLRVIDWSRHSSSPEIYRSKDFNTIMNSDGVFARKFSETVDKDIVTKVYSAVLTTTENSD